MRMQQQDSASCGPPISQSERESVYNILSNSQYERLILTAIEVANLDRIVTAQLRSTNPMHAVNHPHRASMHEDRRQIGAQLSQSAHVLIVHPAETQ